MRADPDAQTAKAHSKATRSGTELVCAAMQQGNIELSGDDHAPVTRGGMRAQYPWPHGPACAPDGRGARSRALRA